MLILNWRLFYYKLIFIIKDIKETVIDRYIGKGNVIFFWRKKYYPHLDLRANIFSLIMKEKFVELFNVLADCKLRLLQKFSVI